MYLFVPKKLLSNNMCFVPLGGYQLAHSSVEENNNDDTLSLLDHVLLLTSKSFWFVCNIPFF